MSFARALQRPARAALLGAGAASFAVAYVVSRPAIHLDALPSKSSKLSIYPEPAAELVLIETPSQLEQNIGSIRRIATQAYTETSGRVQKGVDEWIGVEKAVERKVKEIIPPDEPTTPGILYVGVATLTGSVLGRNRFLLRVLLPPTFFLASLNYFLPRTSHNLYSYITELEGRYLPSLAAQHQQLEQTTSSALAQAKQTYARGTDWVAGEFARGVGAVESSTGVKVGEAFGIARTQAGIVAGEVKREAGAAGQKAGELKERVVESMHADSAKAREEVKRLV